MTSPQPIMSLPAAQPAMPLTAPISLSESAESTAFSPRDVSSRFGLKLREFRRERNLTQLRMSKEFGIDRSFISDVERGRKSISLPMLEVMALGLQVSLSELMRDL